MQITLKVFSWVGIVLGTLALIGWMESGDGASFIGGGLFLAWGIVCLNYISEVTKK